MGNSANVKIYIFFSLQSFLLPVYPGETQLLKGPAMYDRGSPMGVTVIKEQPMSPREKIPVVKDNMCVVDGKQSGDSKEAGEEVM